MYYKFTLLLVLLLTSVLSVKADPLVVTGGSVTVSHPYGGFLDFNISLSGSNFNLSGHWSTYSASVSCYSPSCSPDQVVPLTTNTQLLGTYDEITSGTSWATIDSVHYTNLRLSALMSGPMLTLPDTGSVLSFSVPFTMNGSFAADSPSGTSSFSLVGAGISTIVLLRESSGPMLGSPMIYTTQSATYAVNAVPEPATVISLLTGAIALIFRRGKGGFSRR